MIPELLFLAQAHQIPAPPAEGYIIVAVQWVKLAVETIGAALVAIGVVMALMQLIRSAHVFRATGFTTARLTLARYLALALEFQLGADILSTAIAPSWEQVGKLAAIAVIRTGLNFFLSHEMKEEQATQEREKGATTV